MKPVLTELYRIKKTRISLPSFTEFRRGQRCPRWCLSIFRGMFPRRRHVEGDVVDVGPHKNGRRNLFSLFFRFRPWWRHGFFFCFFGFFLLLRPVVADRPLDKSLIDGSRKRSKNVSPENLFFFFFDAGVVRLLFVCFFFCFGRQRRGVGVAAAYRPLPVAAIHLPILFTGF